MNLILTLGDFHDAAAAHQICQCDGIEELINTLAELLPEIVGQAALTILAVFIAVTAGDVDFLINGADDISNSDLFCRAGQMVTTTR